MADHPSQPTSDQGPIHQVDVTVLPAGWRFTAPTGVSLVTAAQQAGIRLARSCRNGTCRACLCHLRSGQVRYSIDWPGLSADEKDEGCILPCVAQALTDVVLDAPNATLIDDNHERPGA